MNAKQKLLLGFGISTAAAAVAGGFALYALHALRETANVEMQRSFAALSLVGKLNTSTANLRFAQRGVVLYSLHKSKDALAQYQNLLTEAANIRQTEKDLAPLLRESEQATLRKYDGGLQNYLDLFQDIKHLAETGNADAALKEVSERLRPPGLLMQAASAEMEKAERAEIGRSMKSIDRKATQGGWIEGGMLLGILGAGVSLLAVIHTVVVSLRAVASAISSGSHEVSAAAGQIAASSNTLAQNAAREAASLQETSASAEQITAVTRQTETRSNDAVHVMTQVDHGGRRQSKLVGDAGRHAGYYELARSNREDYPGHRRDRVSNQYSGLERGSGGRARR